MEKIVFYNSDNIDKFYKKIWIYKLYYIFKKNIVINYCGKEYKSIRECPKEIVDILKCIEILNERNKRKRLELIYDYSCEYLDNEFLKKNLCEFKNNMCGCNRIKEKHLQISSCCESLKTRKICEHFDKNKKMCNIKSISCKLFACPYLKKKNINYSINRIAFMKYFLNLRQKSICKVSFFQDKDEVVEKLLKFYKWY